MEGVRRLTITALYSETMDFMRSHGLRILTKNEIAALERISSGTDSSPDAPAPPVSQMSCLLKGVAKLDTGDMHLLVRMSRYTLGNQAADFDVCFRQNGSPRPEMDPDFVRGLLEYAEEATLDHGGGQRTWLPDRQQVLAYCVAYDLRRKSGVKRLPSGIAPPLASDDRALVVDPTEWATGGGGEEPTEVEDIVTTADGIEVVVTGMIVDDAADGAAHGPRAEKPRGTSIRRGFLPPGGE